MAKILQSVLDAQMTATREAVLVTARPPVPEPEPPAEDAPPPP